MFCLVTQKAFLAFSTYVRPILESHRVFGLLALLIILKKLSRSKRRFTKRLKYMAELQYSERFAILGVETLELRRLKADLMYIYKIVFGILDVEPGTLDIKWKGGTFTRLTTHSHTFCVEETHVRINARCNF